MSSEPRVADVAALVKAAQGAERQAVADKVGLDKAVTDGAAANGPPAGGAPADGAATNPAGKTARDTAGGDKTSGNKTGGDKTAAAGASADKTGAYKTGANKTGAATSTARSAAAGTGAQADCGLNTSELGPVAAHVRAAAQFLGCRFGKPTMYGVAGRAGTSDHPSGHAVDFMVDPATGDTLADCALRNRQSLGITYVIWQQRINFGSGWQPMEDRGGVTANHFDHVHVSFATSAGRGPIGC